MAENKAKIPEDDFISKVVKDPRQPPDTLLLSGYLGKSSEEGHTRLYFDPELKSYVEIPQEAIQHWQEISKEASPLGGYHVWINPNAELIHGKVGPQRTKAKFFEGPIGAAAAGMGGVAEPAHAPSQWCWPPVGLPSTLCGFSSSPHLCPQTAPPYCLVHFPSVPVVNCFRQRDVVEPGVQGFHAQAQATLPSAHPVCPTLFQHCPSFGCPVTAGCPSAACTINLVQCGYLPNTVFPCRGYDVGADPRAAQAHATLPSAHPVCPTLFQHCPSFGCAVTQSCPSTACTLTPANCLHGTGIPCIEGHIRPNPVTGSCPSTACTLTPANCPHGTGIPCI